MTTKQTFSSEVAERLGYYVYRLIDPRNGETFYVGKGQGDRVFHHAAGDLGSQGDETAEKLARIRKIRLAGFDVAHVIHRHGLANEVALEVEAAVMDAYPGLTNQQGGHGSSDFGVAHADEIIERYAAPEVVFGHRVVMITINQTAADQSVYEAVRFAWKISRSKAEAAEYVLAVVKGMVVGAFVADRWLPATSANFLNKPDRPDRLGFYGREAPADIRKLYERKRVPDRFRQKGAANPIKYAGSDLTTLEPDKAGR
ncbi:LEM-3-like GIY-YIG domain-containing protein [Brevundimonas sp.]|jgi:hypothetical protein|uniref:LEM-3-like GIY-YIG domain-containing protein n=1 Tax=Brevundimonas sp. TaxID=1871086 RepID=UPI002E10D546|nr:hypothetical protein [Brevundimonas sp.]